MIPFHAFALLVVAGCGWLMSTLPVSSDLVATVQAAEEPTAPWVTVIDGEGFAGQLTTLAAGGQLTFAGENGPRELPLENFLQWGQPRDAPSFARLGASQSARLILADGSAITADILSADLDTLRAESRLLGAIEIPLTRVAVILIYPPTDADRCDAMVAELLENRGTADRVTLANGDTIEGAIAGIQPKERDPKAIDPPETTVLLDTDNGQLPFETANVRSIVFDPRTLNKRGAPSRFRVGLVDGGMIHADDLVIEDGQAHISPISAGETWTIDLGRIAYLEYANPRVQWLEARSPDRFQHVPFLSGEWEWRPGKNVLGHTLRVADANWLHGIGVHSAAQLTYVLREPVQRFEARVGVDDAAIPDFGAARASVIFRVVVFTREDGQTVQTEKFTSPLLRPGDAPLPVSVDLEGAVGLSLIVDFGESGDQQDYADWLNARLIQAAQE